MLARVGTGAALAFVLALGAFGLLARGGAAPAPTPKPGAGPQLPPPSALTDRRISALQAIVRVRPGVAEGYVLLAGAYAQKVRENGDAGLYTRAAGLLRRALQLQPGDPGALTQRSALELSRHDFRAALGDARRARRAAPDADAPFGVLVDALVELGRYGAAGRALQAMVDRKPDLAAYARVSYWRELHGDLAGARRAMALALSAGGDTSENGAAVQALLSHIDLVRGDVGRAGHEARAALFAFPGLPGADAALARVELARGRAQPAIARLRRLVARLPLPEYLTLLGESEMAAGERGAGRRDLATVRAERRLLAAAGVDTDAEMAIFEADHGSPRRALALARRAWAAAPSIRSADALGWALTRSGRPRAGWRWARRALALGSRDPLLLAHAGLAARASGARAQSRGLLPAGAVLRPFSPSLAREVAR